MFFKKMAVAAASAFVAFSATQSVAAEELRIGSQTVYPPFEFLNSETGEYVGFDMDLIRAIAERANFKYKIYSMGLDGLIPALMSGSIDLAVSALTITEARAQRVDFTKSYYKSGLSIMTHKDDRDVIKGTKELEGKTLCVEIGSSGAIFSSKIPGVKLRTFNSAAEAFLEINQKGCYAMINDRPVNEYFLKTKGSKMNLAHIPVLFAAEDYGFALKKGNVALRERLEKALDELRADGTYDRIYEKWFGPVPK